MLIPSNNLVKSDSKDMEAAVNAHTPVQKQNSCSSNSSTSSATARKFRQAAGHRNSIQIDVSSQGRILKAFSPNEVDLLERLNGDPYLCEFVPNFYGCKTTFGKPEEAINEPRSSPRLPKSPSSAHLKVSSAKGQLTKQPSEWMILQDLTADIQEVQLLDVKLGRVTFDVNEKGVRTKLREDLYEKMVREDGQSLSAEEKIRKTITKERYLDWRDTQSTSRIHGYRFEGIQATEEKIKTTGFCETPDQAMVLLRRYLEHASQDVVKIMVSRLEHIKRNLQISPLSKHLKMVGVSLLFMYDRDDCLPHYATTSIGMIDFGKVKYIEEPTTDLQYEWLFGLGNLIELFKQYMTDLYG